MLQKILDAFGVENVPATWQLDAGLLLELLSEANRAQIITARLVLFFIATGWLKAGQTFGL